MTTNSSVANGARLDDCHSNIFSLADLSGIKWQRFSSAAVGLVDDPVLTAFTSCLSHDILAVWRRSPRKSINNKDFFEKELWIFWWGDEPSVDNISNQKGLKDEASGCWDEGLSYECRSLLFKAIHNLIERCLLNENFVRIGRWFIKPYCKDVEEDISDRFSFSFSFFLHGESTLCTTVEVAKHQSLERLSYHYVQEIISNMQHNKSVILAPYGLNAQLTGRVYRSPHEPTVKKLMEEWKPFYPLGNSEDLMAEDECSDDDMVDDHIPVPPVVEVIIDGVQMNYPSYYILVPSIPEKPPYDAEIKYSNLPVSERALDSSNMPSERTPNGGVMSVSSNTFEQSPPTSVSCHETMPSIHSECCMTKVKFNDKLQLSCVMVDQVRAGSHYCHQKSHSGCLPHLRSDFQSTFSEPQLKVDTDWNFTCNQKDFRSTIHHLNTLDEFKPDKPSKGCSQTFHHRLPLAEVPQADSRIANLNVTEYQSILSTDDMPIANLPTSMGYDTLKPNLHDSNFINDNILHVEQPQQGNKGNLSGRPFVNLGSNQLWENHVHSRTISQFAHEDCSELKKMVREWKAYKLPGKCEEEQNLSIKSSTLLCDNLDPGNSVGFVKVSPSFKNNHDYRPQIKKIKLTSEDEVLKDVDGTVSLLNSTPFLFSPAICQQPVLVGPVKGELAGMILNSDPYAFDDDGDDAVPPNGLPSADIILKHGSAEAQKSLSSQCSQWSHSINSISVNTFDAENQNIKQENFAASGKSQLEALLTNNYSPIGATDIATSGATYVGTRMSESDLKFSMDDLKGGMFDEDDESGAPTPPDDADGLQHVVKHIPIATASNTVTTNVDLQRIYPTPPSLETYQPFSPDGRPPMLSSISTDKVEIPLSLPQENMPNHSQSAHNEISLQELSNLGVCVSSLNFCHESIKENKHPSPLVYLPVKCLSLNLPLNSFSYTPTWQLPAIHTTPQPMYTIHNQHDEILAVQPTTPAPLTPIPAGMLPPTPGRIGSKMVPSVQPLPSPAQRTPGRNGIRSVDPSESPASYATPSSHVTPRRMFCDQNGNAAIFMNLLLSDSVFNLFRDHSFDQCALCVCNTNITGVDVEFGYLPALTTKEDQFPCSCGFSAIRNRMVSVGTGLFLEDELEVVGKQFERFVIEALNPGIYSENIKLTTSLTKNDDEIIQFLLECCSNPFYDVGSPTLISAKDCALNEDNVIVKHDICEAFAQALSGSLTAMEHSTAIEVENLSIPPLHSWKDTKCDVLSCASTLDIFRLLASLKPVLQDAIQKKKTSRSFGTTQHVKGPLTWREFCKEAQKNAEPQPIPSFVVGYDQDWLCVSPQSITFWEKLFFEPYSHHQDVAYMVLCPDEKIAITSTKNYFKELGSMYESCRLGRFKPINRVLKDEGILKIGDSTPVLQDSLEEEWFNEYISIVKANEKGNSVLDKNVEKIILYAKACIQSVGPILRAEPSLEISTLHVREGRPRAHNLPSHSVTPSGRMTPLHTDSPQNPHAGKFGQQQPTNKNTKDLPSACTSFNPLTAATITVFFLDPFKGTLSKALWQCFLMLQKSLPSPLKDRLIFQVIPLETLLQVTSSCDHESFVHNIRSLAINLFAQCRRKIPCEVDIRSMTGFGPAASENEIANKFKSVHVSLYSPPYVLHIPRDRMVESNVGGNSEKSVDVLFLSYCLSHNQKYVLASATDQCGEILETCCINIDVPPRRLLLSRKNRVSVRGDAIKKLWEFCVNTVSTMSSKCWRIVVGKLGRLSHGEIRDWAKCLNRKSLLISGKRLGCIQCKLQQNAESSFITSACLVSIEAEGALMLMPDVVQSNNFGRSTNTNQNTQLKTPNDVSCTHIYVFPTSAVTQHPVSNCNAEDPLGATVQDFIPAEVMMAEEEDLLNDFWTEAEFTTTPNPPPFSIGDEDVTKQPESEPSLTNDAAVAEDAQLSQQPLALGYMLSTAPPGPLPSWFWRTYPEAQNRCPVFFRSALHIQATVNDSSSNIGCTAEQHPLDSNKTAVILRFVLESFNALSWISRDPVTRDRRSCLPLHCLALMQLYHLIKKML